LADARTMVLMPEEMLVVPITRVLVPGTQMSLRRPRGDCKPGDTFVVILRDDSATSGHSVGTLARVTGVTSLDAGGAMVRLHGERLVCVPPAANTEGRAPVGIVDEADSDEPVALDVVRSLLSRYMALRAEAGLGGNVYPRLSNDPVAASHEVASHLEISRPELQELLEAGNASRRLRKGLAIMRRETELLRRLLAWEGS